MEIVHRGEHKPGSTTFGDLNLGDCFKCPAGEAIYIKTGLFCGDSKATLLSTGVSYPKPTHQPVIPVKAKVVILD
jgi:hypothetical protein